MEEDKIMLCSDFVLFNFIFSISIGIILIIVFREGTESLPYNFEIEDFPLNSKTHSVFTFIPNSSFLIPNWNNFAFRTSNYELNLFPCIYHFNVLIRTSVKAHSASNTFVTVNFNFIHFRIINSKLGADCFT